MPHILFDGRTFRPFEYELEADFEAAVVDHCTDIFGVETVYFDIKKRLGNQNVLTIPDGYLIDFSFPRSPRLYIIENELVKHDPYRHIGQQLLKFAIAYKTSGRKLKRVLYEEIQADPERRAFVEQRSEEAGYRNVDVLLEEIIFDHPVSAIVVIDEVTSDLENVLGQLTMNTDVVELRTFTHDDDVIHHVTPFQQDVRDAATSDGRDTSPEDLDTIVVPARQEGFEEVFLGEDCWYAIRISSSMIDRIKYIAAIKPRPSRRSPTTLRSLASRSMRTRESTSSISRGQPARLGRFRCLTRAPAWCRIRIATHASIHSRRPRRLAMCSDFQTVAVL